MTAEKALRLIAAIHQLEACDRAIAEYTAAGLSDTPHDLEHRQMRSVAWKEFRECAS